MPALTLKPHERLRPRPLEPLGELGWGPLDDYRANFHTLRRLLGELLEPYDLLVTDFQALRLLEKGPARPSALSAYIAISPAATTELLDRLEGRLLLQRSRDPEDRRATVLTLTPKGQRLTRSAATGYERFLREVARELSPEGLAAVQAGSRELRALLERRGSKGGA